MEKIKNAGYVVFTDNNPTYLSLTNILVESVIDFSEYKIEVFGINFDYSHSSDKVISRRIDLSTVNYETICYSKLYSSFNSNFDMGIQLDADFIITKQMDNLFNHNNQNKKFPVFPIHPQDPNNQIQIMDILGVTEKSQPYVHGTYIFTNDSKDFIKECYDFSQYCFEKNIHPLNADETILNVMLWKNNVKNQWINPYDIWYEIFLDPSLSGYKTEIDFYSSHGCKDTFVAKQIYDKIKNNSLDHII